MGLSNVYGVPGIARSRRATLIDGKTIAAEQRQEVAERVATFVQRQGAAPALATILVGNDPASSVYVASKIKACAEVGLGSVHHHLPSDVTATAVLDLIDQLNADPEVSGILCQLPVPGHLDGAELSNRIAAGKDVDALTVSSAGRLALGLPGLRPCTPSGVMHLLRRTAVEAAGKHAVVIGRSNLFGKPMAQMLTLANATVTLCHSRTSALSWFCRQADILIAAVGRPAIVQGNWVKPGATVIDVGINRTAAGLIGDVDFEAVVGVAGALTPVPGGVGPVTIACLLRNTIEAAESAK